MTIFVLLVDDHAVVRDGLRYLLEAQSDIRVVGDANNGRDAVSLSKQLCPDVVVMDIGMPELNGIEATQLITSHCPNTQVIILSMHSTEEYVSRAMQAGARGFVLKESAGMEVVEAVRGVHANHRYLSQKILDSVVNSYASQQPVVENRILLDRLSHREREVLQLVVEGYSSAEIASKLNLSVKTIETYRGRMMSKLGIHDVPGLVKFAIQHGLTSLE